MKNWRELIQETAKDDIIIHCTLSDEDLNIKFDSGYGLVNGKSFTAWSEKRVYFPVCYDGAEWVESVPRNPSGESCDHVGGG